MKRRVRIVSYVVAATSALPAAAIAQAATPVGSAFMYQGQLKKDGAPVNGNVEFQFSLWDAWTGGTQIGMTLTRTDPVTDGLFSSWLDFGKSGLDGNNRYLEIAVRTPPGSGSWTTLSSRQPLLATPYAQYALKAKDLVLPYAGSTDAWGQAFAVTHTRANNDDAAIAGTHTTTNHRGTGVIGTGGVTGVSGRCYPTDDNPLALYYGVSASCQGGNGNNYAVNALSQSSNTALGVFGDAEADTDEAAGGYLIGRSTGAASVYGVHGLALAGGTGTRYGVCGEAEGSAIVYGGHFTGESSGDRTYGIRASAAGTGSGINYGAVARAEGAGTGTKYGLYAIATGDGTETKYGVYGDVSGGGTKYAGYFKGNLTATGTKSFQIDHPLDPENSLLNHYCAEGPEPLNVYGGTIVLDAEGGARVKLPAYFEAINRDFRYQLTPIGAPMPNLHVAGEIEKNSFTIGGGKPNGKVSWEVKGVRNDAYVRQRGTLVEQAKPPGQRGKYLHPELLGKSPREAIHPISEPTD
ncbi:MAG TPA: hypothetical protein PKY77_25980 [Phycisphaerae bacterium]|nr:hypothetical protein [Phycisphaerae bacterium]HRY71461.1 hypothetical protein [Phycisphaerae bacterium]HSA30003.1 hypothetical protein [Phycisphaerae bacterium]